MSKIASLYGDTPQSPIAGYLRIGADTAIFMFKILLINFRWAGS